MCLSLIYESDRALQVGLCHHSIVLYSWLFKQSYLELAQFVKGKILPNTDLCQNIVYVFVEILKNRRPITLYVKPRFLAVISLNS